MPTITLKDRDYSKVRWQELRGDYPELKASGMGEALDLIKPFFAKGAAAVEAYQLGDAKTKAMAVMNAIGKAQAKTDKIKDSSKKQGAKDLLTAYTKGIKEFVAELDKATQKEKASQEATDKHIQDLEAKKQKALEEAAKKKQEQEAGRQKLLDEGAKEKQQELEKVSALTLEAVMGNTGLLNEFLAHCKSEHNDEQLAFLLALKTGNVSKKAIYGMFIKVNAPKFINVPDATSKPLQAIGTEAERLEAAREISDAEEKWNELNFDKCKSHIQHLLERDALTRFKSAKKAKMSKS